MKLQYKQISENLSYRLNVARALAASFVMLGHLRMSLFLPYNELVDSDNFLNLILFFVTRLGHECVLIFFVLSGFLVGGQSLSDFYKGDFSLKKYFINRISRMWTVLIPTLILGFCVDWSSLQLDPSLGFGYKLTLTTFIGNLFFLQTIVVSSFGSNVALWSLAYEFWYYMIFPLFIFLLVKNPSIIKKVIMILILLILFFIIPEIMKLFPIWVLGFLIRFIPLRTNLMKPIWLYISTIILGIGIVTSNYYNALWANYLMSLSFCFAVITWMQDQRNLSNNFMKKGIGKLADISFSMYAIHYFLLYFIVALLQQKGFDIRLNNANLENWILYLLIAVGIVIISYIFYWFFEKRTYLLRNILYKWFSYKKYK